MSEKQIANSKMISYDLIGRFLLFEIIFGIILNFVNLFLNKKIGDNLIFFIVFKIVLQAFIVFVSWRLSIYSTFKKKTMEKNNVKNVMRNLIIFTVIFCIIVFLLDFVNINANIKNTVEQSINSDMNYIIREIYITSELNNEELEKENKEKEALQSKLDQAYNQIKEMATKTVEATGGVKILGNNQGDANK